MAPRQTARRLLVAAPALAIAAFAVTACSPPNEQPADPDAPYTLPTYVDETQVPASEETSADETTADEADADQPDLGETGVVDGEVMPDVDPGLGVEVPVEGDQAPFEGLPAEQPAP